MHSRLGVWMVMVTATRLAQAAAPSLTVWEEEPWRLFDPAAVVNEKAAPEKIGITSYINERVPVALMLANRSDRPLDVRVAIGAGLDRHAPSEPSADQIPPEKIELREVVVVRARDSDGAERFIPDALPRLNEAGVIHIAPHEARQLWININTAEMKAGKYSEQLMLFSSAPGEPMKISLDLHVLSLELPQRPSISAAMWEYEPWVIGRNGQAVVQDITRNGKVDHLFLDIASGGLPWGKRLGSIKKTGWSAGQIDFSLMNQVIQRKKGHGKLILLNTAAGFHEQVMSLDEAKGRELYLQWVRACLDNMRAQGIPDDQVMLQVKDEASGEWSARNLLLTRMFKEQMPTVPIFQTVGADTAFEDIRQLGGYVDVWCVWGLRIKRRDELNFMKATDKPVWVYQCAVSSKVLSPSGYFRATPLIAWREGLQGCGIWSYDAGSGNLWNDFDGKHGDSATVYPGANGPVTSKRWEAWRRGMEDYSALELLRTLVDRAAERPDCAAAVRKGKDLMVDGVAKLFDSPVAFVDFGLDALDPAWAGKVAQLRKDIADISVDLKSRLDADR